MRYLLLLLCCLPLITQAQKKQKVYSLDIDDKIVDFTGLDFRVADVRDETGVTDGRFGRVYTGMVNKGRDLVIEGGMEMNWRAALLRSTIDRDAPPATLVIRFFRIDEEITATSERRRLQLEAALELPDHTGQPVVYGPRFVSDVKGGMDVTSGHADAVAAALSQIMHDLQEDVRHGNLAGTADGHPIDPTALPDGAIYSVADLRAARVDTTVILEPLGRQRVYQAEGLSYHEARFKRSEDVGRQELRELWGYVSDGEVYLYLQKRFYAIRVDGNGRLLVAVPGGITDPEAMTKQAVVGGLFGAVGGAVAGSMRNRGTGEYFSINLRSGALEPRMAPRDGFAGD